jgi:gamma-glutamyltranspeptidase/glutathione hydrolase
MNFEFDTKRMPVYGRDGMVAASQPLAVAAGLEILRQGGNAADAAVAVAAALNVTEPTSTGLGGDCFALYYHAAGRRVYALNGSGRAPAALSLERIRKDGYWDELPPYHPYTVTVPGACAGWCDLVERFGRMSLDSILSPAIHLAEGGFPVSALTAWFWQRGADGQLSKALNGREMTIDGRAPQAGELFRNPGLARTLKAIACGGKNAYYLGEIAQAIVSTLAQAGGCMTATDLAAHHSTWEEPISTHYRGMQVWECAPNGQGLVALLALNLLEGFDLARLEPLSPQRLHLMVEALRLAFADARQYIADPSYTPVPLEGLLSEEYSHVRRQLIDPLRANLDPQYGVPLGHSETVYFSVVDGEGNACSFINSNYMGFGTGIVPQGWGFTLQNRGHNFSLQEDHANVVAPGKRPYHTIIPAIVTHADGSLYASLGVMGGFMQPQGHTQVLVNLIDDGLNPQAALDRPRFCIEPTPGKNFGQVSLEEGISNEVLEALAGMGHLVNRVSGMGRALFGRGQIIQRDPFSGVLCAGSDPRADGCAMTIIS